MVQYAVWTTLAAAGIGPICNTIRCLMRPLPKWNLPESWLLRAQMVIGGIAAPAGEKAFNQSKAV